MFFKRPSGEQLIMKRQLLLSLTLSLLATSAFALPASEQPILGQMKAVQQAVLPTLAQDGKLIQQYQRVAAEGTSNNLARQYQRVADNGPDRLIGQYQRVS
jgi:hypothetical protein